MIALPGQPLAQRILRAQLAAETPAQQLLLHGPAGAGKRVAARSLAWRLADPDVPHDPEEPSLDITILAGTGHLIRRPELEPALGDLATRPRVHARRVLIIDEAARMEPHEAGSRLLKSLEEPGSRSHIILVTDRVGDLLPTVRSRCLPVPFRAGHPRELESRLDPFVREMRSLGVELGLAVMAGGAGARGLVLDAQKRMEAFARQHPSEELTVLVAEAERLGSKRGGRTATKRAEDQAKREVRRAITDGWAMALDGWAGLVADALALGVGHGEPIRYPAHAEALRAAADGDPDGRAMARAADELQLARAQLALNPTTDLAGEALILRMRRIGAGEGPLLPPGRAL